LLARSDLREHRVEYLIRFSIEAVVDVVAGNAPAISEVSWLDRPTLHGEASPQAEFAHGAMRILVVETVGVCNGELRLSGQIPEKGRPDLQFPLLSLEVEARQDSMAMRVHAELEAAICQALQVLDAQIGFSNGLGLALGTEGSCE